MAEIKKDEDTFEEDRSVSTGLFPTRHEWSMTQFMAKNFLEAGAIPKGLDTAQKLIVAIQAGAELGLKPIQSVGCIGIISGRPMIYGNMPMALAIAKGHKIEWGTCNEETATVTITRGDTGASETATLSMKDVKERGLDSTERFGTKDIWKKYPSRMLRYGVFRQVATFLLPDVYNGVKIGEDEEVTATIIEMESNSKKPGKVEGIAPKGGTTKRKSLDETIESDKDEAK